MHKYSHPWFSNGWGTFDSNYSLIFSWEWCYRFGKLEYGVFFPFFSADPQKLCQVRRERRCTDIFSSFHWFSMGFKSGLWLGHSLSFIELSSNRSLVIVAVCLGTDLCGTVNRQPSWRSWALWSRFSSRMSLYNARFIFPTIKTRPPLPADEIHPQSMVLPPPCFTVGMVFARWWALPPLPGSLQMWSLAFRPKSSILVSSD